MYPLDNVLPFYLPMSSSFSPFRSQLRLYLFKETSLWWSVPNSHSKLHHLFDFLLRPDLNLYFSHLLLWLVIGGLPRQSSMMAQIFSVFPLPDVEKMIDPPRHHPMCLFNWLILIYILYTKTVTVSIALSWVLWVLWMNYWTWGGIIRNS